MAAPDLVNGVPVPVGRTLTELTAMLDHNGPERWAAFEAVARTPGRDALNALVARAASPDPLVRRAAIAAIGKHQFGRDAADVVRAALDDSSPYVVRTSCEVLGTWQDDQAHSGIVRLLGSSDPATRQSALQALTSVWQPSDFGQVLNVMQYDPDEQVRRQAAWTMRANISKEAWERVFGVWCVDPLARHRKWACEIAADFGDLGPVPELRRLSHDSDGHVRDAALKAIQTIQARTGAVDVQ